MSNRQVDKKSTFQIRLDSGWWQILSRLRTNTGQSFKSLVEHALSEVYPAYMTEKDERKIFEKKM